MGGLLKTTIMGSPHDHTGMTQRVDLVEHFGNIPFAVKHMNHPCRWLHRSLNRRHRFDPPIRFFVFKGAPSLSLASLGTALFFRLWGFIARELGTMLTMP